MSSYIPLLLLLNSPNGGVMAVGAIAFISVGYSSYAAYRYLFGPPVRPEIGNARENFMPFVTMEQQGMGIPYIDYNPNIDMKKVVEEEKRRMKN